MRESCTARPRCPAPVRCGRCGPRCAWSGFQNVVSLIQQACFSTRSLKPKASNISMVRQAMPSAWPNSSGPGFCSTMQVVMSGKVGRVAPPGSDWLVHSRRSGRQPPPERSRTLPVRHAPLRRVRDFGVAGFETVEMKLHDTSPYPAPSAPLSRTGLDPCGRAPVRASVSTPIGRTVRLRLIRALSQPAKAS